ncbi:MAG: hypothetical protein IJZ83_05685 [Clostridia bacterium]|nr:hypothetical protein [Clostridia bacterium]
MKKFIALLLVAIMAITAVIPAMAAENTDETAPDAPVFVGAQTRDSETEGYSDVRFIATVSSTTGTCVGYEIVANYYEVGETTPAKTVTYTGEETESTTVYTSVLEKGKTEATKAEDLTPGATGIFVVTLTDVPNAQNVDFTVTAYVKYNDTTISSTAKFQRYENGEIMVANTVYSQDFNTTYDATENLKAVGVTAKYKAKPYPYPYTVNNGKLNIKYPEWNYCMSALANSGKMSEIVGSNNAYLYEMNMEIDRINVLGLYLNGDCDYNDDGTAMGYSTDAQNGFFVAIRWFKADGTASATDISGGENLYFRFGWINSTGGGAPSGAKDSNTIDDVLIKFDSNGTTTIPQNTDILSIKFGIAVHKLDTGCRVDLYINDVYQTSYTTSETTHWLKENSFPLLWAQESDIAIDDIRFGNITNSTTSPANNASTPVINGDYYEEDFENVDNYLDKVGISVPFVTDNCKRGGLPTNIANNKLTVTYHTHHTNPDYYATLIESGMISNGQTYYFEAEISDIASWDPVGVMIINNSTTTSSTELQKNGCFVRLMTSSGKLNGKIRLTDYDSEGNTVLYEGNGYREVTASSIKSGDTKVTLGVIVDSSLANGTLVSVYANGVLAGSFYIEGNAHDASSNTSIVLWCQNTQLSMDNITLKTYSSPIAA